MPQEVCLPSSPQELRLQSPQRIASDVRLGVKCVLLMRVLARWLAVIAVSMENLAKEGKVTLWYIAGIAFVLSKFHIVVGPAITS